MPASAIAAFNAAFQRMIFNDGAQIATVLGDSIVSYTFNLCQGNFDYLVRLPNALLLYVILYLDLEDVAQLSQTSRKFEKITTVLGDSIVSYTLNLCQGNFVYLERLPNALLLYVILYLDLEDVAQLSQTSRKFEKLCSSDALWERIVENSCDTITPEMRALSKEVGWKQIFFTNKLQLQMQIRRRRQTSENLVV
ncbi:UNVERIFIED_CONTAM: hypothetical protein FKN15_044760 [Acipenser sinensis]